MGANIAQRIRGQTKRMLTTDESPSPDYISIEWVYVPIRLLRV